MTENLNFQVTENKLYDTCDVKFLSLTNGIYDITVFYYGNYAEDKANGNIDVGLTSISCKSDGIHPEIKQMGLNGTVYLDILQGELILLNEVEKYKVCLDRAKTSALALIDLLKEYGFHAEI